MYAETRVETGLAAMSPPVRARAWARSSAIAWCPREQRAIAYRNHPLPIGSGQTISQPYIVALSTDLLEPEARRHACSRSAPARATRPRCSPRLARRVYSIEIIESLATKPREASGRTRLRQYRSRASATATRAGRRRRRSTRIVVTAAAPHVPPALVDAAQARRPDGDPGRRRGRDPVPEGDREAADGSVSEKRVLPVRFVPLVPALTGT